MNDYYPNIPRRKDSSGGVNRSDESNYWQRPDPFGTYADPKGSNMDSQLSDEDFFVWRRPDVITPPPIPKEEPAVYGAETWRDGAPRFRSNEEPSFGQDERDASTWISDVSSHIYSSQTSGISDPMADTGAEGAQRRAGRLSRYHEEPIYVRSSPPAEPPRPVPFDPFKARDTAGRPADEPYTVRRPAILDGQYAGAYADMPQSAAPAPRRAGTLNGGDRLPPSPDEPRQAWARARERKEDQGYTPNSPWAAEGNEWYRSPGRSQGDSPQNDPPQTALPASLLTQAGDIPQMPPSQATDWWQRNDQQQPGFPRTAGAAAGQAPADRQGPYTGQASPPNTARVARAIPIAVPQAAPSPEGPAQPRAAAQPPMPPPSQRTPAHFERGAYAAPKANPMSVRYAAEDWDEDDIGGYGDSAGAWSMPSEPVPVPAIPMRIEENKSHGGLVILLLTLTLLISLTVVYFTGIADEVLTLIGIPVWQSRSDEGDSVPEVFIQLDQGNASAALSQQNGETAAQMPAVAPASASGAPRLTGDISVEPSMAQAPATLVFTLYSNEAVTAVQFKDNLYNALYLSDSTHAPFGDGVVWQCMVEFNEPYQGIVRVFLSDGPGQWTDSGYSCQVNVRRQESTGE